MRKHAKHRVHAHAPAAVYQPSDFVSVVAIGLTAIVLVLSLFAMERFAGVPVSVHGESASAPSDANLSRQTRAKSTKPSQASKRAAARQARVPASSSSSSAAAATNTVCNNGLCTNLLNPFIEKGDSACMRSQQCVDVLVHIISQPDCTKDRTCKLMLALYSYYYSNQACIQHMTDKCQATVDAFVERIR